MPTLIYTKNGWLSDTSQFTSDRAAARIFPDFTAATEQCKRFYAAGIIAIPVLETDLGFMT